MTIKETAGRVLLYFYQLQRTVPLAVRYHQIGFIDKKDVGVALATDKKWLTRNLTAINSSPSDLLNAFSFLVHKGLIESKERTSGGARIFVGVQLTHDGIDMVEGVQHGDHNRERFTTTFAIDIADDATIESVIKDNLGSIA